MIVKDMHDLRIWKIYPPKGTSPEGQRLNKEIAQRLENLKAEMQHVTLEQEQSGVRRPATTFAGKMDQVHQWMNNPSSDPSRLGAFLVLHVDGWACIYLENELGLKS